MARDLARALGVRSAGGVFEDERYVITWCIGHLVELCEPHEYNEAWKRWQLAALPMLPPGFKLRPVKTSLRQWRVVKEQLRRRDLAAVINACDAGREGELIFRFCYELAGCRLPVERLWISSLTDQAINKGFASLRPGRELEPLAAAARCRAEADWLVGMNATRAVTLWRRGAGNTLFSLGRVQTPTLGLLVSREHAISRFVPRDYFEVHAQLRPAPSAARDAAPFTAIWQAPTSPASGGGGGSPNTARRFAHRPLAEALVARDRPAPAVVERVDKKAVREPPPLLFDLGSLQRTANRRFGWTAQRTLGLAQALYEEHKLLTYPRTDSRHLPSDLIAQLPRTFAALAASPAYRDFAEQAGRTPPPRRVFQDQKVTDHHAIIPTPSEQTPERLGRLSSDERSLLDLVSRRFLAAFFPDAEFEQTAVVVRVDAVAARAPAPPSTAPAAPDPDGFVTVLPPPPDRYHARGRVRIRAGWQEVAGLDEKKASRVREPGADPRGSDGDGDGDGDERDDDEATQVLPPLAAGQALTGDFAVVEKQTRPPPRYTEATLLGAMESAGQKLTDEALREAMRDAGLGTPATRASIIETLVDRRYIQRRGKQLLPTPLGIDLIDKLPHKSLTSAQLTGEWEARLSRMARGEEPRPAFMADIGRFVGDLVDSVRAAPPPPPVPEAAASATAEERGAKTPRRRETSSSPPASGRGRGKAALAQPPPRLSRSRGRSKAVDDAAPPKKPARTKKKSPTATAPAPVAGRAAPGAPPPRPAAPPVAPRAASPTVARPAPGTLVSPPILCPRCRAGRILWGRRAWGCSNFHQCPLVVSYEADGRARSEQDLRALLTQGGPAVANS